MEICFTWIELDTIESHAFCVQVARLYLILIGRIQCWKYFIINGQVRLISSDLFTDCVNTGCRIEVMTCSCHVKIMQSTQPTNWHALVCLFIISFALRSRRAKIRQGEESLTQRKHSSSEMYYNHCFKNHCRNVCVTLCLIKEMSAADAWTGMLFSVKKFPSL